MNLTSVIDFPARSQYAAIILLSLVVLSHSLSTLLKNKERKGKYRLTLMRSSGKLTPAIYASGESVSRSSRAEEGKGDFEGNVGDFWFYGGFLLSVCRSASVGMTGDEERWTNRTW